MPTSAATSASASTGAAGGSSTRQRVKRGRNLVGHTCAWKAEKHLPRRTYEDLMNFCNLSPDLAATISRKQLEIAVRRTSQSVERKLRLVRRDIVDATDEEASELPVIGRVDKNYVLKRNQMRVGLGGVYATLDRFYSEERDTIHTTIVAKIIKRYVSGSLFGFSLRDHGGVYFVSQKREDELFALDEFLRSEQIGHITHFGVGGDEHETRVLSEEIQRGVETQIEQIREAFQEADLSKARARSGLRKKVRDMREELVEMRDLFGFAQQTLDEKDAQARSLLRDIARGTRELKGADLFSQVGTQTEENDPYPLVSSGDGQTSGDGQASGDGQGSATELAKINFSVS